MGLTVRLCVVRQFVGAGDSVRFFSNMLAYDLDDFLDWHMGLQKPDRRPCLGCGKPSMVDRYYCDRCAQLRKGVWCDLQGGCWRGGTSFFEW